MTDSSDLYEYRLETVDSSDGSSAFATMMMAVLVGTSPITASVFFDTHVFNIPFDLQQEAVVVLYAVLCVLSTVFTLIYIHSSVIPEDKPERLYFGQHGFRFEGNLFSHTASFYRPADKVRRISLGRDNVLELTDSLGNTFRLPQVRYSLQSERELAECFPHAMVWQAEQAA